MLNLEPGKFREVRNMKTYLCVNGSHSKVVLRVSRRNKATVPYHDGRIEFEESGMLVSFSKFDDLAQVRKREATVYVCGKVILRSNVPIEKVELMDKNGARLRGKTYPAQLYPTDTSSSSSSSASADESLPVPIEEKGLRD
mmetsp:Transcript_10969/g.17809  ORF Transcript_10969/g.17809 Transcript_10969/m.17809 type:complete len:141 (-) Transcript_10969:42-464(-)